jgi:predicted nucleic acid-binding protein
MIVVADTSPLNYLVAIDEIDLLPALFGRVLLPEAAFQELKHPKSPLKVHQWLEQLPPWIDVRSVATVAHPSLMRLDPGEREAIQLALDLGVRTVLIDDAEGRRLAEALQLEVRGTLGVLERGARLGKVNFGEAMKKLEQTRFRISPAARRAFLDRNPH